MAIIIEEEKKELNWYALIVVLVIVAVIGITAYFLFFAKPELAEVVIPNHLKELPEIVKIKLNPADIFENPFVKNNLNKYVEPVVPEGAYNSNPFNK
jgi:flagellar basal body-associated protein FliL